MNNRLKFIFSLLLLAIGVVSNATATTTTRQYLSGTGSDNTVEWDFFCSSGAKSGEWSKIAVPSCWELQGFGHYNYGHDAFEDRVNEHGLYKYNFNVPKEWKGEAIRIVFEAVMTDAEVKINGKLVGEKHQGAFYEFKYDIEKFLKYGAENLLEVRVDKASSNMSINHAERKADFWIFGGIFRPVYLEVMPRDHIERVAIDAAASGDITMDLFTDSKSAKGVEIELQDLYGEKISSLDITECEQFSDKFSVKTKADNIKTWNAEHPNLYQLKISITDDKGAHLHTLTQRIGFRTVEFLESDGIYVNGQKIKFKGVNRHSFHPETGRTLNRTLNKEHIELMKEMNMNAVRMSHYPPDVNFLDLCDSLGLFVIDEVCTWHTPKLDTEVGRKIVREMVTRDVNHPSILMFSNGNETGWNTELDDDYPIWDIQKREVIHPWNSFRKTNTLHYPPYYGMMNDARSQDKIMFHTEFLHGLYDGGHGAGLEDYWNIHWNMPLAAGGFLWCFADEGVVRLDKDGILDTDGNHAADGILGPYLEKEASFFTIKEIWSPIYIEDRIIRNDFTGQFRVENRYHFTNLSECKMIAKWVQFSSPNSGGEAKIIAQSSVSLPALEPLEKGSFGVDLVNNWQDADALHLTAYGADGKEIFTWSYPVQLPAKINERVIKYNERGDEVKSSIDGDALVVTAKNLEYVFDKTNGEIVSVKRDGKLIPLSGGPKILDLYDTVDQTVSTITTTELDGKTEFTFIFEEALQVEEWVTEKTKKADSIQWTVHSNGLLDLRTTQKSRKKLEGYKGLTFSYPEESVAGMKWLGDGPYRVWRNRTKGTRFQVWENDYNNTITGDVTGVSGFVYPEFKGFFSSLYWADIKGKDDNGFRVYCHTPYIYLRMFTPAKPADFTRGNPMLDRFPEGDISFVMNIPAIATKFQDPDNLGPHGATETYYGNYDEMIVIELTFDFQ